MPKALKLNAVGPVLNSGFKRYEYRPSIMAFYFDQQAPVTGGLPIINAFINFKIKRASIFLKLDYIDAYPNPQQFYAPVIIIIFILFISVTEHAGGLKTKFQLT